MKNDVLDREGEGEGLHSKLMTERLEFHHDVGFFMFIVLNNPRRTPPKTVIQPHLKRKDQGKQSKEKTTSNREAMARLQLRNVSK